MSSIGPSSIRAFRYKPSVLHAADATPFPQRSQACIFEVHLPVLFEGTACFDATSVMSRPLGGFAR